MLFEHNENAYRKLILSLNKTDFITINHATGTGKSFIALKYLWEHKDKKFLYIAPTYHILEQLKKDAESLEIDWNELNIDTMIYRGLLDKNMEEIFQKYDVFIFDEYHRCGARETFLKMKELKELLVNNGGKKFIGLTATPIRYLDDERNMTEELFDGNVASTLSLSEAIVDGILPVPIYITFPSSLKDKYTEVLSRVNKMAVCDEKQDLLNQLKLIKSQIGEEENISILSENMACEGKYIVFCSDIASLKKQKVLCRKWFKEGVKLKRYEVHSHQSYEKNSEILNEFSNNEEGLSLLFSVNVLNEGVHVSGIDGVILMRNTMSPIIYFQQIGRALSYGSRNKVIKIFDLVNNFNVPYIYQVYDDVKKIINERIEQHPEDKEYYEEMLLKFQILDYSKDILDKLDNIKNKVTNLSIIKSKIDYSIKQIIDYKNENEIVGFIGHFNINDQDIKKYYNYLLAHSDYIDNFEFKQIKENYIFIPFMSSYEEREKMLEGYESIYLKNLAHLEMEKETFFDSIKYSKPDIDTSSIYVEILLHGNKDDKKRLKELLSDYSLSSCEKLLLSLLLNFDDVDNLILEIENKLTLGNVNSVYYYALKKYDLSYRKKDILELLDKLNEQIDEDLNKKSFICKDIIDDLVNYALKCNECFENEYVLNVYSSLSSVEKTYFSLQYQFKVQNKYQEIIERIGNVLSMDKFLNIVFDLNEDNLNLMLEKIEKAHVLYNDLYNSLKNDNLECENLTDMLSFFELNFIKKHDSDFYLMLEKNINALSVEKIICEYVMFYKKYNRKPLLNSNDEDEKKLCLSFNNILSILSEVQQNLIFKKVNRGNVYSTCDAFVLNERQKIVDRYVKSKIK